MPRSNQNLTFSQLRVGIFVLAALVVTGFLILNSTGSFNPFEKKTNLKIRFQNADGLHSGAAVQLAGVSIGEVEDVRFLPPDSPPGERIEATLSVVEQLDGKPINELIRTDSVAQLVATSMLGNEKLVNITPGTVNGVPVDENAVLKTSPAVGLNELTATGNDLLAQINRLAVPANEILNKANRGEGTLGRVINDESLYENLDDTLRETKATITRLQATVDKVNSGEGSAGRFLNDPALYNSLNRTAEKLDAISSDIRAGRGTAGKLLNDDQLYADTRAAVNELRESGRKISEIADDVKQLTTDLRAGKGTAGKLLTDDRFYNDANAAVNRFNLTISRLDTILSDAQAGRGTLGKILTDDTLYYSVNQTANNVATFTGEGTKLLDDFRRNPKKYLSIKLSLF